MKYRKKVIDYHKQNYLQIEKEVNKYYYDEFDYYSSSLDILASYLKGQKNYLYGSKRILSTQVELFNATCNIYQLYYFSIICFHK